jgi:hypothetical protein
MPGVQLVRYDAMCHAITAAFAIDEVKDIHDKALAIETYARQAKNVEAESQACEIRLRAERRAGQLLGEMEKARGARGSGSISHDQSSRWQKLAAIPEAEFEATFAKPSKKPSTSRAHRSRRGFHWRPS